MSTSRRAVMAGLAGTVIAGAAPAAILDDSPDAALLALGEALDAAWLAEQEDDARYRRTGEWGDEAIFQRCSALVDRIARTPAYTLDGLRVKAKAISWCHSGECIDLEPRYEHTTDMRMAHSILRDLGLDVLLSDGDEPGSDA